MFVYFFNPLLFPCPPIGIGNDIGLKGMHGLMIVRQYLHGQYKVLLDLNERVFRAERIRKIGIRIPIVLPTFIVNQIPESITLAGPQRDGRTPPSVFSLCHGIRVFPPSIKVTAQ